MTFILHIGAPKTGTTAIQKSLLEASNSKKLEKKNILYLNNQECKKDIIFLAHNNVTQSPRRFRVNSPFNESELKEISINYLKKLQKEKKYKHYISSSESLFRLNEEEIINLKRNISKISKDMKVIYFIRNPLDHYVSRVSQNSKFLSYLNPKIEDYKYEILMGINNWKKIFKENFLIFEYDKYIENEGKIVGYFSDIVNNLIYKGLFRRINNLKLKNQLSASNVSLSAEMLLAIKKYRLKYKLKDEKKYPSLMKEVKKIAKKDFIKEQNTIKLSKNAKSFFINENIELYRLLKSFNFKYLGNWEDDLADGQSLKFISDKKYELEDLLEFYDKRIIEKIFLNLEKYTKIN